MSCFLRCAHGAAAEQYDYHDHDPRNPFSKSHRGVSKSISAGWQPKLCSAQPSGTAYNKERPMVGTSVDYRLTQHLSLFLTGRNIMNAGIATYRIDLPGYLQRDSKFGSNWAIGMKGTY